MNKIFIRIAVGALLASVKNAETREDVKDIAKEVVQGVLLAYADDGDFLNEVLTGR